MEQHKETEGRDRAERRGTMSIQRRSGGKNIDMIQFRLFLFFFGWVMVGIPGPIEWRAIGDSHPCDSPPCGWEAGPDSSSFWR